MNPIRLDSQGHSLEIALTSIDTDAASPRPGDAHVSVTVQSGGFVGCSQLALEASDLQRFCRDLAALDRTLDGEVRLASMSPGALELRIHAVSSRGLLAVSGTTGCMMRGEGARFWHAVSFGFEFHAAQLAEVLSHSWLRRYAA